jgi:hypothetical protein
MPKVDNSTLYNNTFTIETDSGAKYIVSIAETAPSSGVWVLNFLLIDGTPQYKEIFSTFKLLQQNLKSLLLERNIQKVIGWISGKDREEINQKTKVFLRWVEWPFVYEVDNSPEIRIPGRRQSLHPDTNFFLIKRVGNVEQSNSNIKQSTQNTPSTTNEIKFCFNCGTPNNSYQFCPSCGTKLKQ